MVRIGGNHFELDGWLVDGDHLVGSIPPIERYTVEDSRGVKHRKRGFHLVSVTILG